MTIANADISCSVTPQRGDEDGRYDRAELATLAGLRPLKGAMRTSREPGKQRDQYTLRPLKGAMRTLGRLVTGVVLGLLRPLKGAMRTLNRYEKKTGKKLVATPQRGDEDEHGAQLVNWWVIPLRPLKGAMRTFILAPNRSLVMRLRPLKGAMRT